MFVQWFIRNRFLLCCISFQQRLKGRMTIQSWNTTKILFGKDSNAVESFGFVEVTTVLHSFFLSLPPNKNSHLYVKILLSRTYTHPRAHMNVLRERVWAWEREIEREWERGAPAWIFFQVSSENSLNFHSRCQTCFAAPLQPHQPCLPCTSLSLTTFLLPRYGRSVVRASLSPSSLLSSSSLLLLSLSSSLSS